MGDFTTYKMPQDAIDTLMGDKTSLRKNPAIPDVYDTPFLYTVA